MILSKRRKHSFWRRRYTTFLLLFLLLITITTSPFVWRMDRLRRAESNYDVQRVKEELQWWEMHGGILNQLAVIRDATLWLDLNVGGENVKSELAMVQDEKHQFWLFLLNLQKGQVIEAQNVLDRLDKTPLSQLGQGMMSMTKGDVEASRRLLAETEMDWETLPIQAQVLRHLTLAQAAVIVGDHQVTQTELEGAQRLEPYNPACLSMAFDIAIGDARWAQAQELSGIIEAQTWRPKNTLFEKYGQCSQFMKTTCRR